MKTTTSRRVGDGESPVRELIEKVLQDGYEVSYVTDGADAIAQARAHLPDLLLLNVRLARVNGYSVCQALKADPRTQRMPIILLAGADETAARSRGIGMGADDYIATPFETAELKARVKTVLQRVYA